MAERTEEIDALRIAAAALERARRERLAEARALSHTIAFVRRVLKEAAANRGPHREPTGE